MTCGAKLTTKTSSPEIWIHPKSFAIFCAYALHLNCEDANKRHCYKNKRFIVHFFQFFSFSIFFTKFVQFQYHCSIVAKMVVIPLQTKNALEFLVQMIFIENLWVITNKTFIAHSKCKYFKGEYDTCTTFNLSWVLRWINKIWWPLLNKWKFTLISVVVVAGFSCVWPKFDHFLDLPCVFSIHVPI